MVEGLDGIEGWRNSWFLKRGEREKYVRGIGKKKRENTLEKKGWTVATSEVSMCCGARRGLRISAVLPGLLWTGTHVGLDSSWGNRNLLFGRGGRCRIPPKKLLLCLFIIQDLGVPATHTPET